MLFFNNKLIRGNRAVKKDSSKFDAFISPNIPPLATVGVDIKGNCTDIFTNIDLAPLQWTGMQCFDHSRQKHFVSTKRCVLMLVLSDCSQGSRPLL